MRKFQFTAEDFLSEMSFDIEAGVITLTRSRAGHKAGTRAGSLRRDGYRKIQFRGVPLKEHQLLFFIANGYWAEEIDHINGNPLDNRLCNIRNTNFAGNNKNKGARKGRDLPTGVVRVGNNFGARIGDGGSSTFEWLGTFETKELAQMAYMDACRRRGYSDRHGK